MSRFVQRGQALAALLEETVSRRRHLRGMLLVDSTGLPLASTFASMPIEERLAALASIGAGFALRARTDLEMGSPHLLHFVARFRRIVLAPVDTEAWLVAFADADANAADLESLVLAMARDLLAAVGGDSGIARFEGTES